MNCVIRLSDAGRAGLEAAGGKAANLGRLIENGFDVPGGFCITTEAYRSFVSTNGIGEAIRTILGGPSDDLQEESRVEPDRLERISSAIRSLFANGSIPPELDRDVRTAYRELGTARNTGNGGAGDSGFPAVAVRSSATAEDLPDLSFAGQQDTYLNVIGEEALLAAVRNCWGSYWTARAIGYRDRNGISHIEGALAVVVQIMVDSTVSGVLFTVNPLTGKRGETVVDAVYGLGEALVTGIAEPDHYAVACGERTILSRKTGAKALSVRGKSAGGTSVVEETDTGGQALADEDILELARTGRMVEKLFGSPQDIEWAMSGGRLYLLQSRPVTTLYPLPPATGTSDIFFSFGSWQGMLEPFTPLGQDFFTAFAAGIGAGLGLETDPRSDGVFVTAGGRLFLKITPLFRNPAGRKFLGIAFGAIDPVSREILGTLESREEFAVRTGAFRPLRHLRLFAGILKIPANTMITFLSGKRGLNRIERIVRKRTAEAEELWTDVKTLGDWTSAFERMCARLPIRLMPYLICFVSAGQVSYQILLRLFDGIPGGKELTAELARGLPGNVTTEMDLRLWETAETIAADETASSVFMTSSPESIAGSYLDGSLTAAARSALNAFLERYGMRGIGEIDLGNRRWNEDPAHVIGVLQGYLQRTESETPPEVFRKAAEKAEKAGVELEKLRPSGSFVRTGLLRFLVRRFRTLGGYRETPKLVIVGLMEKMRVKLLEIGRSYAERGVIDSPGDLFFLHVRELEELGGREAGTAAGRTWKHLVRERRAEYEREKRRKTVPRILLSDGTAFCTAPSREARTDDGVLSGDPVSAGSAEGIVRVVFDPLRERLLPGEILVCPATDPAWTPLFLTAGGLVMETGGMMTHGSVVAREYGIPAVVGVSRATAVLRTGMRVRVDGSSGVVAIIGS